MRRFFAVLLGTVFALVLPTGVAVAAATAPADSGPPVLIHPGAIQAFRHFSQPPTTADCEAAYQVACYEPAQIETAYGVSRLFTNGVTGKGQTIIIVDSFGSPTIAQDLATFDSTFGLPAPPSLKVLQPAGPVPSFDPTNDVMLGWAGETSLDVEYAHAMAPGARIVLLETPVAETEGTTGFPQIVQAEEWAIAHHLGGVISQSFSATEQTFATRASLLALRGAYVDAFVHHITVLAASGDSGAANVELDGVTYYTALCRSVSVRSAQVPAIAATNACLLS